VRRGLAPSKVSSRASCARCKFSQVSIQRATNQDGTTRYVVRWREGGRQRGRRFDRLADARAFGAETLKEWLAHWFAVDGVRWEKNARLDRACVVDRWIAPYLGDVRLRDLGRARIIEWRAAMLADGASPYQTSKALGTLSAALGSAVDNERLPANPCVGIIAVVVVRSQTFPFRWGPQALRGAPSRDARR